jgi:Tol biopolymer transport system component
LSSEEWQLAWKVFEASAALVGAERRRFVESSDVPAHVRDQVLTMLDEEETQEPDGPEPGREYGRYTILRLLSKGGMGEVFAAEDRDLNRTVAIKFIGARGRLLPSARERLIREAQAASALNHPNFVTVHEVLQFEQTVALVTEWVKGQSLRAFASSAQPVRQIAIWGAQIAHALTVAHAESIVHSDIKPENIMLRGDGYIKILDFGLAQGIGSAAGLDDIPLGTLGYISPEQTRGEALTGASDVFSLGVTLLELATGRHPFLASTAGATTIAITERIVEYAAPALGHGKEFAGLLRSMLDKNPSRRPTMAEVARRLDEVAAHNGSRRLWPWMVGAAAAIGIAAWLWVHGASTSQLHFGAPVAITKYSGVERQPSFSADGRLAFVWSGSNGVQDDIYIRTALETDETPQRLTNDRNQELNPVWSPDGRSLGWHRRVLDGGDGELWVAPVSGLQAGPARMVAKVVNDGGFQGLAWTPDSAALISRDRAGNAYPLVMVRVADGSKQLLTNEPEMQDYQPQVSPDGKRLLFFRYNISRPQVCFLEFANPTAKPVCRHIRTGLGAATWTLDSRFILLNTQDALWQLNPGSPQLEPMTKFQEGVFSNLSTDVAGGRYAFNRTITDSNIWSLDVPTGSHSQLISSSEEDSEPQFSPDGSRILFRSSRTGHFELYSCNRDGSGLHQLTHLGNHCGSARWSPDGKWIAYDGVQDSPGPAGVTRFDNIYVIPAAGGKARRLTDDRVGSVVPNWSADSRWIYFARTKDRQGWKVPVDGGPAVLIDGREMWGPVESANGRWIWYEQPATGKGLWRRPVNGGAGERIPGTMDITYRTWELRGDMLVFSRTGEHSGFWRLDLAQGIHGPMKRIASPPLKPFLLGPATMSVSPDGKTILYTSEDLHVGDIYVMKPAGT